MAVAALDIGLKRIGVAVLLNESIASPLPAILRKNRNQAANDTLLLLKEYDITTLVVGIPLGGSSEDEMRRRIEHFIKLLDFKGEVFLQDEANSSVEAKERMQGSIKQKRDGKIDSIAAQIILERWLFSKQSR